MIVDVSIVLMLIICFLVGRYTTRFIYRKLFPKPVIVRVTFKDGQKKEILLSQKAADALIVEAKAHSV